MFVWLRRLLAPALALALVGCGSPSAPSAAPAAGGGLNVVVAFYPYQFVAGRVLGDLGTVSNLTPVGAEPHDLELSARQIASLATADLVIYQRGFQAAVDEAITQAAPRAVLDVTTLVPPVATAGGSSPDPHLWLDPTNLSPIATAVADALGRQAPAQAERLAANAATLAADLAALDQEFSTGLAACSVRTFVTTHTAFGYLADRYDLDQVGIAGLDPEAEPSAARIKEIHALVTQTGVTTIFFETLTSDAVAKAIAGDLGLRTDVLDPVEGLSDASRGGDYPTIMRANLAALRQANTCR